MSPAARARLLTPAGLRWILRHRAYSPYHLLRLWRFAWFRLRHPRVITEGFVFLGKGVKVHSRKGHARVILGRFSHVGDGTRLYAHEGSLRIGDKTVLGAGVTITCYLDVEVGSSCLLADWTYISDFDHDTRDLDTPIKDQGLVKSPVRIGSNSWLGLRSTILRGSRVGRGVVVGAHAVVRGTIPDHSIAVGVPARVVKDRRAIYRADAARRGYLEGLARGAEADLSRAAGSAGPVGPVGSVGEGDAQRVP